MYYQIWNSNYLITNLAGSIVKLLAQRNILGIMVRPILSGQLQKRESWQYLIGEPYGRHKRLEACVQFHGGV